MIMEEKLWKHIQTVKSQSPLVHNITNYVVMNTTANALLAVGASPVMAHAQSEVEDMTTIAHALVVNIGTLDEYWCDAMLKAAQKTHNLGKAWVLDPVGAGATKYRDKVLQNLLQYKPTVIKGNASEIMALAKSNKEVTKGVDSTAASDEATDAAKMLATQYDTIVCITGAKDIIIGNDAQFIIENGDFLMSKVTGMGCTASAITGAFIGVVDDKIEAVTAAMALIGIAGELAAKHAQGPGSLQVQLIDMLYNLSEEEFYKHIRLTAL